MESVEDGHNHIKKSVEEGHEIIEKSVEDGQDTTEKCIVEGRDIIEKIFEEGQDIIEESVEEEQCQLSENLIIKTKEVIKKQCHHCHKTFLGSNLWRHVEEVHNQTKYDTDLITVSAYPHECQECNFRTKRKFDLKRHYKHKHSLCDLSFACERCGKAFQYESSLKRHYKTCQEHI